MTIAASRNPLLSAGAGLVLGSALVLGALAAPALAADAPALRGASGRQLWRLSDYTTIELVPREPGPGANEHPWTVEPNALHAWLQQVTLVKGGGLSKPLFAIDELNNIVPALVAALASARPDQDVALVSSARHEDNTFYGITAVTARLFVAAGHLDMIVHDARLDFYDAARGSGMAPHFTVGSRTAEGSSPIQSPTATNRRADWLVLATKTPAAVPAPAPVTAIAPPPVPAASPESSDPEQRLVTLKRLYDRGLITPSEYDKKRAEILQGL